MPAPKITKEEKCYWDIKAAMAQKRLKQKSLAKRLGYPNGQGKVSRWLNNIYAVDPRVILQMSDILDFDIFASMTKHWKE